MAKDVWVYAEHQDGKIAEVSLELLGEGQKLARKMGSKLSAILIGDKVTELADPLGHHGADTVYLAQAPSLRQYNSSAILTIISDLIKVHSPSILMFGATPRGRDMAPQIAMRVKGGFAAECTLFDITSEKGLQLTRPIHNGKLDARCVFSSNATTQIVTVVPGLIGMEKPGALRKAELINVDIPLQTDEGSVSRVIDLIKGDPAKIDIREADIIVAAGKGVGGEANFRLVEELATVLKGSVGVTRQVVDMGLAPMSRMVGMTGKYVSPRLYIACGISGASQHIQGMRAARNIIAINTDRSAPIFKVAQTSIIGDISEVLPQIINGIRQKASA